jgi:hypothetical protein
MTTQGCERRWHSSVPRADRHRQARRHLGPVCFPVLKAAPDTTICTAIRAVSTDPPTTPNGGYGL